MAGEVNIFWNSSVDAGLCHGCGNRGMDVEVLCIQAVFETKRVCVRLCKSCAPVFVDRVKSKYLESEVGHAHV